MGKGIVVKDRVDIDCVVFFNNVKIMEEYKCNLLKIKDCFELCFKWSFYRY